MGSAYGKPSISKVNWSYEYEIYSGGRFQSLEEFLIDEYLNESYSVEEAEAKARKVITYCRNNRLFYSFSKGKVTANGPTALKNSINKFEKYSDFSFDEKSMYDYIAISVKASATDGTGYYGTKRYLMREAVSRYKQGSPVNRIDGIPMRKYTCEIKTNVDDYQGMRNLSTVERPQYAVTSSSPNVAFGSASFNRDEQKTEINVITLAKGTTTITITALDGSNKKTTIKVYVE